MANQSTVAKFSVPNEKDFTQNIPVEMWATIFKHLTCQDLRSIGLVNRRFNCLQQYICNKQRLVINFQTNHSLINRLMDRWFTKCMTQSTEIEMDIPRAQIETIHIKEDSQVDLTEKFKFFGLYCNVTQLIVVKHSLNFNEWLQVLLDQLPKLQMLKVVCYRNGFGLENLLRKQFKPSLRHFSYFNRTNLTVENIQFPKQMPKHLSKLRELYFSGLSSKIITNFIKVLPESVTRFGLAHQDGKTLSAQLGLIESDVAQQFSHIEICHLGKAADFDTEYFKSKFSGVKYLKFDGF